MTVYLKQNTASQEVPLGYFVDSTDGNTEETGLTIANTDIKIWKNGATTLVNKNSGGANHISNGIYYAVLDATDTNTLGNMVIFIHVAGALAVRLECCVLAANVYDSLVVGGDLLQVDTTQISNAAVSTTTAQLGVNVVQAAGTAWGSGAITAASIATNAIGAAELAADAVTEIATGVWALGTRTLTAGTNINGSTFTAIPWNASWDVEVQSEVTDALNAYDPPTNAEMEARTLVSADYATASALTTVGSNVDAILIDTGTDIPALIADLPTNAELASAVAPLALEASVTTIDGNVDDIKAKTDSLTFTQAGMVDANIQYVNDVQVIGTGTDVDPWNPA